jgi:hypothetical protein
MAMTFTLLLALCLQDTETLNKAHREGYQAAVVEYDRAVFLTESDPKQALQILDRIFDNKKLDKKDRRLIFERPNGILSKPVDFFPNQARGRVRLILAKSDPENVATLVAGAVADLKASSDAGLKSSDELLKTARGAQEKLKYAKPPDPPKDLGAEKAFRDAWLRLVDDRKFKSARDFIDVKGGALASDRKREYLRDTEDRCRKSVMASLDEFLKAMELNSRPPLIRQLKAAEFARLFALPSEAEVIVAVAELDWARKERPVLEKLRQSEARPHDEEATALVESMIAQTLAAEPLERTGENRWFKASGQLTFRYVEEIIQTLATLSKDATPEQRQKLREGAERARAKWTEGLAKFPKDFLVRNQVHENPRRLATLLEEFPVDSAEIDKVDLDACFLTESPDSALEHVISDLTKIRDQQGARLPKDSMRKLLTELAAATAVHELLAGKSAEEVAKGLQELGRSLAQAGGPVDPARWGPKVEKIFAALK